MKTAHKKASIPKKFIPEASSSSAAPPATMTTTAPKKKNLRKRTREPPVVENDNQEAPYTLPYLPHDIVRMIVSYLDYKQLAQSTVLAKPFQDCLKLGQRLDFDTPYFKKLTRKRQFAEVVGRIMDRHNGPKIQSLKLWFDPINEEEHWILLTGWIRKAAQKGVEEIDFDFYLGCFEAFQLRDDILQIQTLQILRLCFCEFILPQPPANFALTGLRLLRVLSFRKMNLQDMTIVHAILKLCLLLESMELLQCRFPQYVWIAAGHLQRFKEFRLAASFPEVMQIAIDAPELTTLHYSGPLVIFQYRGFRKLTDCILDFRAHRTYMITEAYKLDQLMHDISNIEFLCTTSRLLEGMCNKYNAGGSRIREYFCLARLKEIQLFMEGARYCNLFTIVAFLRKCPSIEKIHIDVRGWFRLDRETIATSSKPGGFTWVAHQQYLLDRVLPPCYPNLKELKLTSFRFDAHEIQLLLYFIDTGLNLETIAIFLPTPRSCAGMVDEVDEDELNEKLGPRMASPKAKIRVFEHYEEKLYYPSKYPRKWHNL